MNNRRETNMDRAEALRSIQDDLLEYIQKKVKVDFDNARQVPVSFTYKGKTHSIRDVLGRFRTFQSHPAHAFLVRSKGDADVYFLMFQTCDDHPAPSLHPVRAGFWVLSFRVLGDRELMAFYREDRKMLINITFKRVVDFHGHLCPDLVLGGKLCEYVQKLCAQGNDPAGGVSIIAENSTSAVDAIQVLLGATVGNQRLQIVDFGRHTYTLLPGSRKRGFKLSLRRRHYGDEVEYNALEEKIVTQRVMLDEVVQFQSFLDARVKHLMGLSPEDLFEVTPVRSIPRPVESASVYVTCSRCGQQILKGRTIHHEGESYCIPCYQQVTIGCSNGSLH